MKTRLVVWCSYSGESVPNFGSKGRTLVRTEVAAVAIDLIQIRIAGEEVAAIGAAVHRIERTQRRVGRVRVGIELGAEVTEVEITHKAPRDIAVHVSAVRHQHIEEREHFTGSLNVRIVPNACNLAGPPGVLLQLVQADHGIVRPAYQHDASRGAGRERAERRAGDAECARILREPPTALLLHYARGEDLRLRGDVRAEP